VGVPGSRRREKNGSIIGRKRWVQRDGVWTGRRTWRNRNPIRTDNRDRRTRSYISVPRVLSKKKLRDIIARSYTLCIPVVRRQQTRLEDQVSDTSR